MQEMPVTNDSAPSYIRTGHVLCYAGSAPAGSRGAHAYRYDSCRCGIRTPSSFCILMPLTPHGHRYDSCSWDRRVVATAEASERFTSGKDAKLAQKLGQLQPFQAVFPQECVGQHASFGPT